MLEKPEYVVAWNGDETETNSDLLEWEVGVKTAAGVASKGEGFVILVPLKCILFLEKKELLAELQWLVGREIFDNCNSVTKERAVWMSKHKEEIQDSGMPLSRFFDCPMVDGPDAEGWPRHETDVYLKRKATLKKPALLHLFGTEWESKLPENENEIAAIDSVPAKIQCETI
jgi:hypothetical protein